jgi:hypothetical protein
MYNTDAFTSTGKQGTFKGVPVQVVDVKPGDTLLLHISEHMALDDCRCIMEEMQKEFPKNHILLVNKWILEGMTIVRQTTPIDNVVDEVFINQPLEQMYPELFTSTSGGKDLW